MEVGAAGSRAMQRAVSLFRPATPDAPKRARPTDGSRAAETGRIVRYGEAAPTVLFRQASSLLDGLA